MAILKENSGGGSAGGGGGGSARAGCTLIWAALGMFALVIGVSLWSLISQDSAIAEFTQDTPDATRISEPAAGEMEALRNKLDVFSESAAVGKVAELVLDVDDLNLLVGQTEAGRAYRGMVYFTEMREENGDGRRLVADVCLTMNKLKFWEKRYLVGEMEFDLRPVPAGLDLIVTEVLVPGKEVPEQFSGTFANWHWLAPYHEDPVLKPTLEGVRSVEILEESVILRSGPKVAEAPAS